MTLTSRCRLMMVWPTVLAVICAAGCSRPVKVAAADDGNSAGAGAPFHPDRSATNSPAGSASPEPQESALPENTLPFHESQELAAGTLLTVRIESPISAGISGENRPFEATVDEAVVVDGNTRVPKGATVLGRVESSRTSKLKPNRGYIRLSLESLQIGGVDFPIQTASLFVRQASPKKTSAHGIRIEKGRRLTFRLTEPVYASNQRAPVVP